MLVAPGSVTTINAELRPLFADVARNSTFFLDTIWIRDRGITTGCGIVTYCPKDPVTREQMAAFITRFWRFTGNRCPAGVHPFGDVSVTSFAFADVACIYNHGITTGTSATEYSPSQFVTREQMAAFLARTGRLLNI